MLSTREVNWCESELPRLMRMREGAVRILIAALNSRDTFSYHSIAREVEARSAQYVKDNLSRLQEQGLIELSRNAANVRPWSARVGPSLRMLLDSSLTRARRVS